MKNRNVTSLTIPFSGPVNRKKVFDQITRQMQVENIFIEFHVSEYRLIITVFISCAQNSTIIHFLLIRFFRCWYTVLHRAFVAQESFENISKIWKVLSCLQRLCTHINLHRYVYLYCLSYSCRNEYKMFSNF